MPQDDPPASRQLGNSPKRSTDSMIPSIYAELRQLAIKKMANESAGQTLSATALVHEAYLVLAKSDEPQWDHKGHFYVAAAEVMRRILIDRARRKLTLKRGQGEKPLPLIEDAIQVPDAPISPGESDQLIAVDDALSKLAGEDERKAKVVKLRYFVGLSVDETADALDISPATAKRDWVFARAWLLRELGEGQGNLPS
jgi:RNA polymerase sigma factor (TIGR02999 family)